jgi:hypothetical protein
LLRELPGCPAFGAGLGGVAGRVPLASGLLEEPTCRRVETQRTVVDRGTPSGPGADSQPPRRAVRFCKASKSTGRASYGSSMIHAFRWTTTPRNARAAVARKNFYGSGSLWSGRLAAAMFSLLATLAQWKLNPRRWLTWYLESCAAAGGKAPAEIQPFLPWNLSDERRSALGAPAAAPSAPNTS